MGSFLSGLGRRIGEDSDGCRPCELMSSFDVGVGGVRLCPLRRAESWFGCAFLTSIGLAGPSVDGGIDTGAIPDVSLNAGGKPASLNGPSVSLNIACTSSRLLECVSVPFMSPPSTVEIISKS